MSGTGDQVGGGIDPSSLLAASSESSSSTGVLSYMFPMMMNAFSLLVGVAGIAIALLYKMQDSLLYFPAIGGVPRRPADNPRRYRSPAEHNLPFESHQIRCEDGVNIHAWLLLQPRSASELSSSSSSQPPPADGDASVPTLIFFHGNAGNIGLRIPNAIQMYHHLRVNILMVEYRGYGESDNATPNEKGLKLDSEGALEFIRSHPRIDPHQLFIFGRSLGGAVGFHLASYAEKHNIPLAGLIVENTFLSIAHMVDHLMPLVAPIKNLVLRIGWNNDVLAPNVHMPILYLAGGSDELVPPSHMMALYRQSVKSSVCARMHVVPNGRHNETWLQGGKAYWEKFASFLREAVAISKRNGGKHLKKSASSTTLDGIAEDAAVASSGSAGGGSITGKGGGSVTIGSGGDTSAIAGVGGENGGGTGTAGGVSTSAAAAIPLMPGNFIGMAREAVTSSSTRSIDPTVITAVDGGKGKKEKEN